VTVPLDSTVRHRAYYKAGSGLYGPKKSTFVDDTVDTIEVEFHTLTMNFMDQDGTSPPDATGNERAYIDYVGYKADGDTVLVPLDSKVRHRAYYKQGSGLYGPKKTSPVIDGGWDLLDVEFCTIEMSFTALILSGNERVYMDYVGYKADGDRVMVPKDSTIRYRAYYKQGSGLYGPKTSKVVDCTWEILEVEFWTIRFRVVDTSDNLVTGAQVYVDYVGYVENDGQRTVPLSSTIRHKAKVGNVWSAKHSKLVAKTWNIVKYVWDGSSFSGPTYHSEIWMRVLESDGDPIPNAPVQYHQGGWKDFGTGTTDADGLASMMLSPGTYNFRATVAHATQQKGQNVASNPIVDFRTKLQRVELQDHLGNLITSDPGTNIQYHSGGWRLFGDGSTGTDGYEEMELLPLTHNFHLTYKYAQQQKGHNIGSGNPLVFKTKLQRVELRDSNDNLITSDPGTNIQYHSGGWRLFGDGSTNTDGYEEMEMLPLTHNFHLTYKYAEQQKGHNIGSGNPLVFKTKLQRVELRDWNGNLITSDSGTNIQYHSGGWRLFGDGSTNTDGYEEMEMLPLTHNFHLTFKYAEQQKGHNIGSGTALVFQTGQVHSVAVTCTHYHSGGWRTFTQDMEMLPLTYNFRFSDIPDKGYKIKAAQVNNIH